MKSSQDIETLQLTPSQVMISSCLKDYFSSHYAFHVTFNLKRCPAGFSYKKTSKK